MVFLKAEPVGDDDALTVWREGKCRVEDALEVPWWITAIRRGGADWEKERTGKGPGAQFRMLYIMCCRHYSFLSACFSYSFRSL